MAMFSRVAPKSFSYENMNPDSVDHNNTINGPLPFSPTVHRSSTTVNAITEKATYMANKRPVYFPVTGFSGQNDIEKRQHDNSLMF